MKTTEKKTDEHICAITNQKAKRQQHGLSLYLNKKDEKYISIRMRFN